MKDELGDSKGHNQGPAGPNVSAAFRFSSRTPEEADRHGTSRLIPPGCLLVSRAPREISANPRASLSVLSSSLSQ